MAMSISFLNDKTKQQMQKNGSVYRFISISMYCWYLVCGMQSFLSMMVEDCGAGCEDSFICLSACVRACMRGCGRACTACYNASKEASKLCK